MRVVSRSVSPLPPESRAVYDELMGRRCACGNRKREQQSFCLYCYHLLSVEIRSGLYASFRSGYLEAYKAAKARLVTLGRIQEVA